MALKNTDFVTKLILLFLSLFSLYAGYIDTSVPAFILIIIVLILNLTRIKLTFNQLIVICIFILYAVIILINSKSIISTLSNLKWFYGILFFFIIFRIENIRLNIFRFLSSTNTYLFFLISIIIETCLINLIFDPIQLYGEEFKSSTLGIYNRPLGGVGNSSVTSTFIIAWYYSLNLKEVRYQNFLFFLYSISVLLLMSGVGFVLYFIALIYNQWVDIKKLLLTSKQIFRIIIAIILIFILSKSFIQKISLDYYFMVFNEKFIFLSSLTLGKDGYKIFSDNYLINLLGFSASSEVPLNGGDFGWLNLIHVHGLLGFLIFILIILSFGDNIKKNKLSILILFLGAFHYAAIFLAAGQLLLAKLLLKDK